MLLTTLVVFAKLVNCVSGLEYFHGFTTNVGKCTSLTSVIIESCMGADNGCSDGSEKQSDGICIWPAMLECVYSDTVVVEDCIDACLDDNACLGVEVAYTEGNFSDPGKCELHRSFDLQAEVIKCWSFDNETMEFTEVGDPDQSQACRTLSEEDDTSYGHATSVQTTDTSLPDCESACEADSDLCKGMEYKGMERLCELHYLSVDYSDAHYCYLRIAVDVPEYDANSVASLSTYQDYDGEYTITGDISVAQPSTEDTVIVVLYSLSGLEPNMSGIIKIHEGMSCEEDLGDGFFDSDVYDVDNGDYDPWTETMWVSDQYGASYGSVAVDSGYGASSNRDHAVVVQLSDGTVASCGVLECVESSVSQGEYDTVESNYRVALGFAIALAIVVILVVGIWCYKMQNNKTVKKEVDAGL